jgi:hypothetical protein
MNHFLADRCPPCSSSKQAHQFSNNARRAGSCLWCRSLTYCICFLRAFKSTPGSLPLSSFSDGLRDNTCSAFELAPPGLSYSPLHQTYPRSLVGISEAVQQLQVKPRTEDSFDAIRNSLGPQSFRGEGSHGKPLINPSIIFPFQMTADAFPSHSAQLSVCTTEAFT